LEQYQYRLICYKDAQVGELRFLDRSCSSALVSAQDIQPGFDNNFILRYDGSRLYITADDAYNKKFNVDLFGAGGRLLQRRVQVERNIEIENMPQGLVFVRISDEKGAYKTKKVIIQKN
jgi:hypothetical protein